MHITTALIRAFRKQKRIVKMAKSKMTELFRYLRTVSYGESCAVFLPRFRTLPRIFTHFTRRDDRQLRNAFRKWANGSFSANEAYRHWILGNRSGQDSEYRMYISQDGKAFWGNAKDRNVVSTFSKPFELMDDIQKR